MIRSFITLLLILVIGEVGFSQEPSYSYLNVEFISPEPTPLPSNLIKTDFNGDTLSVVIVKSPIFDLTFEGNIHGKPDKKSASGNYEYLLYITEGSRNLKIRSNKYHQAEVKFPRTVGNKELWNVYIAGVESTKPQLVVGEEKTYSRRVNVDAESFVKLYVDEEPISDPKSIVLEEGTHYISSRYNGSEYNQKVNVKNEGQNIDAKLGGTVVVKNASSASFYSMNNSTPPNLESHKGSTYKYDEMVGKYTLNGKPNSISFRSVEKQITVKPRSTTVFRLDEMVPYGFALYRLTSSQPIGFNAAVCKDFGGFVSYTTDAVKKIETPYGETEFVSTDSSGKEHKTIKSTSMTLSAGPMFRLWHKLYLQVGGGWAYYLSTSEPKVLTPDYRYKSGLSLNADLIFRIRSFVIGAGYTRQFVKDAYDSNIANQVSISLGLAFGI